MKSEFISRARSAGVAACVHFGISMLLAVGAAMLVWGVWYPPPFDALSGGRKLFLLIVAVDMVCGPLLTLVIFDLKKPTRELLRDLGVIGSLQCAALLYGLWTMYEARPLFLVHEVERFRVIAKPDFMGVDVSAQIAGLPESMRPRLLSGPKLVGALPPLDVAARQSMLREALRGGRDFVQRPEHYVPYDEAYASMVARRARPLRFFVEQFPDTADDVMGTLTRAGLATDDALFLPVVHRQDWIAILGGQGKLVGFAPGDGFAVR